MPVNSAPLSRPSAAATEAEQAAAAKKTAEAAGDIEFEWYILKVQSNREKSIAAALQRKVQVEGLDKYFDKDENGDPLGHRADGEGHRVQGRQEEDRRAQAVPGLHRRADAHHRRDVVRGARDLGDRRLHRRRAASPRRCCRTRWPASRRSTEEESAETPKLDIKFKVTDRVKVKDGTFEGFEGEVGAIDPQSGKITVMINIFGRSTPVELEYWQVEGSVEAISRELSAVSQKMDRPSG